MADGIIIIDKPAGWTSMDVCGNPLAAEGLQPGLYRVYSPDGAFLCLSRWEAGVLTSEKNFFGA